MSDLRRVPSPLLTIDEVADYLGVSRPQVYRLRVNHGLPSVQFGRKLRRFRKDEVDRWLDEQQREENAA